MIPDTATPAPVTPAAAPVPTIDPMSEAALDAKLAAFYGAKGLPVPGTSVADMVQAAQPAAPAAPAAPKADADDPIIGAPAAPAAPAEGEQPAPVEGDAPAEGEPALDVGSFTVDLPPRNPNGAPVQLVVADEDTANRLRQLNKGYMRGEQAREVEQKAAAKEAEAQQIITLLESDPTGLVMQGLPADQQLAVARALVLEHFDALAPDLEKWWNDEGTRRLARADVREGRIAARETATTAQTVAQQVSVIVGAIESLVPEDAPDTDAQDFVADARRYLGELARQKDIKPQDVPALLATRLARYGFTRTAPAAAPGTPAAAPAAPSSAAAPVAAVPPTPRPIPVQRLSPTVAAQRAAASASAPVGAGASPARIPTPPKGLTIEQAADWLANVYKAKAS